MKILSANDKWHNVWILIDPGIMPFVRQQRPYFNHPSPDGLGPRSHHHTLRSIVSIIPFRKDWVLNQGILSYLFSNINHQLMWADPAMWLNDHVVSIIPTRKGLGPVGHLLQMHVWRFNHPIQYWMGHGIGSFVFGVHKIFHTPQPRRAGSA